MTTVVECAAGDRPDGVMRYRELARVGRRAQVAVRTFPSGREQFGQKDLFDLSPDVDGWDHMYPIPSIMVDGRARWTPIPVTVGSRELPVFEAQASAAGITC